ncbi:MAG: LPXTG cell wall anchor domain-containing protein [Solirubrobacteraceae bacterium]
MPGAGLRRTARWIVLVALLALALAIPAVTLAAGGGSAGDQQYTDPFAGTPKTTSTATQTQTAPSTSPAPTTTAAPSTSPTPTTSAPVPSSTAAPSAADPTATTALNQLPYTGYSGWLAAAFGFALVAAGVIVRRRLRRT